MITSKLRDHENVQVILSKKEEGEGRGGGGEEIFNFYKNNKAW